MWQENYQTWRDFFRADQGMTAALNACAEDEQDARDRFYRHLAFGTGGLRGKLGLGTNRMNIYTVVKATRGLARYLRTQNARPSCAIGYDSRNQSEAFAQLAAAVLAERGVKVFLYPQLMPTPMLSFAVRHLRVTGGVVITASHNPAIYNGYKVYGADGCQITQNAAQAIEAMIAEEPDLTKVLPSFDAQLESGAIEWIGPDVQAAYYEAVRSSGVCQSRAPLHVVYSPLNGAGNIPVREILRRMGNVHVTVVPEQELPDGDFSTCVYPNPEEASAMALAERLAREVRADLFIATDPDSDRVGVGTLTEGGVRRFTGNELGVLLLDFICMARTQSGTMPARPVAVKTIVTTEMAGAVAKAYSIELINVLTGFKYIGDAIGRLESRNELPRFLFGFEESCGYLNHTFARDKDAVSAAMLVCEMAAYYKARGLTLGHALDALYERYGFYQEQLLSYAFDGAQGMDVMRGAMDRLRQHDDEFASMSVARKVDYLKDNTGLPKSDMLAFDLPGGSRIHIRPSGTEPKLKFYVAVSGTTASECAQRRTHLCDRIDAWVRALKHTAQHIGACSHQYTNRAEQSTGGNGQIL